MVGPSFVHHNSVRIHRVLKMTPAMAAGVRDFVQDMERIVGLIGARPPEPKKRGPYKKAPSKKLKLRETTLF